MKSMFVTKEYLKSFVEHAIDPSKIYKSLDSIFVQCSINGYVSYDLFEKLDGFTGKTVTLPQILRKFPDNFSAQEVYGYNSRFDGFGKKNKINKLYLHCCCIKSNAIPSDLECDTIFLSYDMKGTIFIPFWLKHKVGWF